MVLINFNYYLNYFGLKFLLYPLRQGILVMLYKMMWWRLRKVKTHWRNVLQEKTRRRKRTKQKGLLLYARLKRGFWFYHWRLPSLLFSCLSCWVLFMWYAFLYDLGFWLNQNILFMWTWTLYPLKTTCLLCFSVWFHLFPLFCQSVYSA